MYVCTMVSDGYDIISMPISVINLCVWHRMMSLGGKGLNALRDCMYAIVCLSWKTMTLYDVIG